MKVGRETQDGPAEAADFLHGAITDLLQVARNNHLDMLCYLLDIARLEASEIARAKTGGQSPPR